MASAKRDYYEALGVARDASEQEIKKAFRGLARELHPDVSNDPESEAKFREVAEAYEVLSKAETRELYDRFGHDGLRSGGFRPTHADFGDLSDLFSAFFGGDVFGDFFGGGRRTRGADVLVEVEIDLVEAAHGTTRELPLSVTARCSSCDGSGARPGTAPSVCPTCGGAGRIQKVARARYGQLVRMEPCPTCHGGGRVITDLCEECEGQGHVRTQRALRVDIPPGIHEGQRLRLVGEGHASGTGGSPGDVYVSIRVRSDARFQRDGDDIVTRVDVTVAQAALGAGVTVATLDGDVELEIKPGSQPGEVIVLRGKGMPVLQGHGRGDQRIFVNVLVPRRLSEEQRRLLEEFERLSHPGNYDGEESFFDRLKAAFR